LVADRLLAAMASLRRTLRRRALRPTELFSLTGSQLELVRLVRRQPGVSVAEAASELRLAPNTVSTLVRQLSDLRLLSRSADASDRRVARLDLSTDIRRKVDAWRDRRVDALTSAMGQLSVREERCLEEAVKVLARLGAHLTGSWE
jgi:DNA-binding MarR family transcriptional regulator